MRIYDLDEDILRAVQGSGIKLIIGVPNEQLQSVGSNDPSAATQFVQTYVVPYASNIKYIAVGNEVVTQKPEAAQYVGPAMQHVLDALNAANLGGQIKVTTAIGTSLVINAYPPSSGEFSNTAFMGPVVNFLASNGSPLLLNIYTYFSFDQDLSYRLFTSPGTVITDPNNGLPYQNLFDALMDATYAALSKVGTAPGNAALSNGGASDIHIAGSESGWKSGFGHPTDYTNDGENGASLENAQTYYRNLIDHVKRGTPLKPGQAIEMYLFEMFDEDNKPGEQYFGLFTADQKPKYNLNFS